VKCVTEESIWAFGINCDSYIWGLHNNGNFVQYGQLLLGGKLEVNVGGAACDEESGIQRRTEGKEGKHLNILAAGPSGKHRLLDSS
jgi:hypothetical protein